MRFALCFAAFLPLSNGFAGLKTRSFFCFGLAASENGYEPNGSNGDRPPKKRKRRKRCVDYPSFAYNAKGQYETMRQTVVGDRPSNVVATYRSPSDTPRTVSIPSTGTPNNQTIFEKIVNQFTEPNTAFSTEITQVSNSAVETRLLNNRCYATKGPFTPENITSPPSLADLSPPPAKPLDRIWISSPFRVGTFLAAYLALPYITEFLSTFVVTQSPEQLDEITSKFGPGISILYGTFVSLTLSISYNRQQAIQSTVSQESAMLTVITRSLLSLFKDDKELAIQAGQCAADQIRTLVRGSRGGELVFMMYSDPYDRMMELVDLCQDNYIANGQMDLGGKATLIAYCRDVLKDLNKFRAMRLSDEALALPPTHFIILNLLTSLGLLGYVISILPTVDAYGVPSRESCLLFGILCSVYVLFYNFTSDLNNPFEGVYQLRRSSTASHLLEAKWLIANHPLIRGEVDFQEMQEEANGDVLIRSPGIGDLIFVKEDIFPDSQLPDPENDSQQ